MPSFTITPNRPLLVCAKFSKQQSSAIASLAIDSRGEGPTIVEVSYQSRPEQFYEFAATPELVPTLRRLVIEPLPEGVSLGGIIAKARRSGHLQEVAV